MRILKLVLLHTVGAAWLLAGTILQAQSINLDIGEVGDGPPATYAAAGRAGVWNSDPAIHGTTSPTLVDIHGNPTVVTLTQIGGLDLMDLPDPAVTGDDAALLDDFLITFDAGLESCIFMNNLEPGTYEVLVYARMPDPEVLSYSDVDQEAGNPFSIVGGIWPGQHEELISYSRHLAVVDEEGSLDLHSGIVPGADETEGAAFNGLQILRVDIFSDGFESGDVLSWGSR